MRRIVVVVVAMAMILGFVTPSFAILRKDLDRITGKVIRIDLVNNQVTIQREDTGINATYTAPGGDLSVIKEGQRVLVVANTGSTTARTVRAMITRPKRSMIARP